MRLLRRSPQVFSALGALICSPAAKSFRVLSTGSAFISGLPTRSPSSLFVLANDPQSCKNTLLNNQQQQQQQQQRGLAAMSDEQAKAQTATPEEDTIFDKIVRGDIPCKEVYSDDKVLAFHDVNPTAPVHILVIPKNRDGLSQLSKAREDQKELLGHLMYVAQEIGAKECPGGFRVVINDGKDGAQSVYHLHLHVIGGRPMKWPPG